MGSRKIVVDTYSVPISAKGIVFEGQSVWLRKNERNEWELPGGKVDSGEQVFETVIRELNEELGFHVEPIKIVQAWMLDGSKMTHDEVGGVLVISYLCRLISKSGIFETKGEAGIAEFSAFALDDVDEVHMPQFYKEAIQLAWLEMQKMSRK